MKVKNFIKRNGSTILTCVGAVGVVATAVTAVRATPKVVRLLEDIEEEKGEELTKLEVVKIAGPHYIPSILIGAGTLACIFGANVLNRRHQAALMSAYALLDNSYKEYKGKVKEVYGEEADLKVRTEIAKDKYVESDLDYAERLFYDEYSGRYFNSTMENVIQAEYELNRRLAINGVVYLNEFYELLDVDPVAVGTEVGWSSGTLKSIYWANWIEFKHEDVLIDDDLECCIISARYEPVIDFAYY